MARNALARSAQGKAGSSRSATEYEDLGLRPASGLALELRKPALRIMHWIQRARRFRGVFFLRSWPRRNDRSPNPEAGFFALPLDEGLGRGSHANALRLFSSAPLQCTRPRGI